MEAEKPEEFVPQHAGKQEARLPAATDA